MPKTRPQAAVSAPTQPKATPRQTKQQLVIDLLSQPEGATLLELSLATGWLTRTVHGAMSGALKKRLGLEIISEKVEDRGRIYRLINSGAAQATSVTAA